MREQKKMGVIDKFKVYLGTKCEGNVPGKAR